MVQSHLPPEDLREGRPPDDYQEPERFFARTYLTQNLRGLTTEVVRRLLGISNSRFEGVVGNIPRTVSLFGMQVGIDG